MEESDKLYILWTSGDIITAEKMVMMYSMNSMLKGWWKEVTVIIWGSAVNVAASSPLIQEKIKMGMHAGVKFSACKACADQLGVTENIAAQGIEVIYWGEPLTEVLKGPYKLLTV